MKFKDNSPSGQVGQLDTNGFLRVRARFARTGLQGYRPEELGSDDYGDPNMDGLVMIYRPETEVFDPESMRSLEGMPVTADAHEWQYPGGLDGEVVIGSVAGQVQRDGDYLVGSILVTCPHAIERVQSRELVEISCGYAAETFPEGGIFENQKYNGTTRKIRYNHLTILPPGMGRAGEEVRITDKRETMELVAIHLPGKIGIIRVAPESQPTVTRLLDAMEEVEGEKKALADQVGGLEEKLARLEEINAQIATLQSEKDQLSGELAAVKATLEEATNGEAIQAAASELSETQDAAEQVMGDSYPRGNKMSAKDLRKAAALHYIKARGIKVDSKSIDNQSFLDGIWHSAISSVQAKRSVPGAQMFDRVPQSNARQKFYDSITKGGK